MIDFAIGVAIGAAFAPFWMTVWGMIKDKYDSMKTPKQ
jgi:large-conductance mechanosensitive channel